MTGKETITFVTSSMFKKAEVARILAGMPGLRHRKVVLDEFQADLKEIVMRKARLAAKIVEGPVLVEDVSLHLHALCGFPGPFVKFAKEADWSHGYDAMAQTAAELKETGATAICGVGYCDGSSVQYVSASVRGDFVRKRGESGFGFDPYFVPAGCMESFAEMDGVTKDRWSHRGIAFRGMRELLLSTGDI